MHMLFFILFSKLMSQTLSWLHCQVPIILVTSVHARTKSSRSFLYVHAPDNVTCSCSQCHTHTHKQQEMETEIKPHLVLHSGDGQLGSCCPSPLLRRGGVALSLCSSGSVWACGAVNSCTFHHSFKQEHPCQFPKGQGVWQCSWIKRKLRRGKIASVSPVIGISFIKTLISL